jgi:nucleoside 2-deoxyribosyltransferase
MLTIKHVNTQRTLAGFEADIISIWEGDNVRSYLNPFTNDDGTPYEVYTVAFDKPDGCMCSIDSGVVYVMNEAGKTVETFRLSRPDLHRS